MRRGNVKTNEKENKKSNIDKRKLFSLIISLILLAMSIASVVTVGIVGILPFKYMIVLVLVLLLINSGLAVILLKKRKSKKIRNLVNILQFLFIIIEAVAIIYVLKTYSFMNKMTESANTKKENYLLIVLNDSKYNELKDLKGKVIEYYSNELDNSEYAVQELKKKVDVSAVSHQDVFEVGKTLLDSEVDAILLEESQKLLLDDELEGFKEKTKVIYTIAVDITVETIAKDAAVASEPFILYISGIDMYGEIATVSRSDVNMVVVVNPKTYQVLLVSIPRDYYVQLHGTSGKRDKLTHAGMYGVEMSVKTIEDLLDIDINYYFKVNFSSVEIIVDAIGGIEVYSEFAFTDYEDRFNYVEGYNKLNGPQALAFARERKAFTDGDRMRGKNQQAVLSAIVDQVSKPSIITKVDGLLKSLSNTFQTNMETSKMMELVKLQISKMPTWKISTVNLTGSDARAYAYSSGSTPLYVMLPSQNSINDAISKIQTIISGGILEGAYDSVTGNITSLKSIETPVYEEEPEEIEETDDEVDESVDIDKDTSVDVDTDKDSNSDSDKDDNTGTTNTPGDNKENGENGESSDTGNDTTGGTTSTDKEPTTDTSTGDTSSGDTTSGDNQNTESTNGAAKEDSN